MPCLCPPCRPCTALPCKVPYRGRFRSDNHAAVLRLQKTQPKDRRDYDAPYRNPCRAGLYRDGRADTGRARAAPMFFICIPGEEPFGKKMN